eukprot:6473757-Amphidinium_carterae.1
MRRKSKHRAGALATINPPWDLAPPGPQSLTSHRQSDFVEPTPKCPPCKRAAIALAATPRERLRSPGTPRSRTPGTPIAEQRPNAPVLNMRARGSLEHALSIAADPVARNNALEEYRADIAAPSSMGPNASAWASWCRLHTASSTEPVLPLTPHKIEAVAALLKAG